MTEKPREDHAADLVDEHDAVHGIASEADPPDRIDPGGIERSPNSSPGEPEPEPSAPTDQPSDEDVIAQNLKNAQFERGRQAMYIHAAAVGQLLELPAPDVPRLLVAAACRTLEGLMEAYDRTAERNRSHGRIDYIGDRQRKAEIVDATLELITALEEGLSEAHKIRLSLIPREHR